MGFFSNKVALALLALLILIVLIPLIVFLILARRDNKGQPQMPTPSPRTNQALEGAASWPVIGHNVSVCSSSEPSSANIPTTIKKGEKVGCSRSYCLQEVGPITVMGDGQILKTKSQKRRQYEQQLNASAYFYAVCNGSPLRRIVPFFW
jgi:hypothetical protein